jgi:WD40 repeat protein
MQSLEPLDGTLDIELPPAPYPGLRPFDKHEWPVFFGRERMADEVVSRLINQHLVVVHGDSGCGKSSLVRAGVLVQLEQGHARSGVRWRTCSTLPREAPLRNLATALAELAGPSRQQEHSHEIRRVLNHGREAPAALAGLLGCGKDDHVCILIDQFEELFSFARKHGRDEAQLFVDILVGLLESPPTGLYAILTMRSEFLGVCARFKGLAEAVNHTQYLLPQMERPALLRAIREPAPLYDGEVSRELAERLIADAGGGQDQLPLIQHGLMLLWRRKVGTATGLHGAAEAAVPFRHESGLEDADAPVHLGVRDSVSRPSFSHHRGPAWRLGLEDYRGAGSLIDLLSSHADEVMAQAAPNARRKKIVEHLFRALTDINAEGSAVRRPQTLAELAAVTGCRKETLNSIIDHFRAEGVSFLRPYRDEQEALEPGTLIDISHEALIRCWHRIADPADGWLQREFRDGLLWKTLRMQAQRGETLSAAATEARDAWLRTLPSPAWSERYDDAWDDVQRLMVASRKARDQELQNRRELEEAQRREAEERARRAEEAHRAAAEIAARQQELREAQERVADEQRRRAEAERQRAAEAEARAHEADAGRRQSRRLAIAAGILALVALVAAGAASWSLWQTSRARAELQQALASVEAELTRRTAAEAVAKAAQRRALVGDSFFRAEQSRNERKTGSPVNAMLIALAGLPDGLEDPEGRPWVGETAGALAEAIAEQRENLFLPGGEEAVLDAAFSPDGQRIVAGSWDAKVRVWNAADGAELLVLNGHRGPVNAVAFAHDGARIVSGSGDHTIRVWDAASGEELLLLAGHERDVLAAGFSPEGDRIVSGSADGTVRVWDAASGEQLQVLEGHGQPISAAAFSPDGARIVSGGDDNTVRVWDAASGEQLLVLDGHQGHVLTAAFSPDGARVVTGATDWKVRVWDAESGAKLEELPGHRGAVWAVAFAPDGNRIVSASADRTVRVWEAPTWKDLLILSGHEGRVRAAAFSPDGARIVSGSDDDTVRLWDAGGLKDLLVLRGHEDRVRAAAFSPDRRRIVSGSWDDTVRVWDGASGRELWALHGHAGDVLAAAYSPDGARIVSGAKDNTVRVWDAASGEAFVLRGHDGWVNAVAYSPDGTRIISGSADGTVRVWTPSGGEKPLVLLGHDGDVLAAAFSPDGRRIASGSADGTVRVWDAASGAELLTLDGHGGPVNAVAYSPDDARIVSGSADDTLRVWDAETGSQIAVLSGHGGDVLTAVFSPDGARILSGSADETVRVWDATSGEEFVVLRGHDGAVWTAAFAPDGAHFVSGSDDNTVRVSWIPSGRSELLETARMRLPRELTEDQRRRFHLALQ